MSDYDFDDDFPRYVSANETRRRAKAAAAELARDGRTLEPVASTAKGIARSFWGRAWCKNLERYSDYESRLPRGRSYLRNGCVLDLRITTGRVDALVQGTRLYESSVSIRPLDPERWHGVVAKCRGQTGSLLDLLAGKLAGPVMACVTSPEDGLFPDEGEIKFGCTCPDSADLCKHVAAVLYGIGAKLDGKPELLFTLRGVDHKELVAAATDGLGDAKSTELGDADLGTLFGIDLDDGP